MSNWFTGTVMRRLTSSLLFPLILVCRCVVKRMLNLTFCPSSFNRSAFTSWLLMNVLLVNVPRYGAYTMIVTGMLMGLACLCFYLLMPPKPLDIRFEDVTLTFRLGWCFWLTLVVGQYPRRFSRLVVFSNNGLYSLMVSFLTFGSRFILPLL